MLNRNKALTNFITGILTSFLLVIVFVVLGNTNVGWIGDETGTSSIELAGIAFGISIIAMLVAYLSTTLPFTNPDGAKRSALAQVLSSLTMAAIIAFSVFLIDYEVTNQPVGIIFQIIIYGSLLVLLSGLIWFVQEMNTKFLMSSIAKSRADEWEFSNFWRLVMDNISVEHRNTFSVLTHKNKPFIIKFISEDVIERKVFLSGDHKSKLVFDLEETSAKENAKAFVVYISNTLPIVEGNSEYVSVIKNSELFDKIKEDVNGK